MNLPKSTKARTHAELGDETIRREAYELIRNRSLGLGRPEGISGSAPYQETPRNNPNRYGIPLPAFSNAQSPPPPAITAGNNSYLLAMQIDDLVTHISHKKEEVVREEQGLKIKEQLMYEQLDRAAAVFANANEQMERAAAAVAKANATSFKGGLPGGNHVAPFPYQGVPPLPPWMTGPSPAAYTGIPPKPSCGLPASAFFHPGGIAAGGQPYNSPLSQPHSEFAFPRYHLGSEAFAIGAHPLPQPPPEFAFPRHHHGSEVFAIGAHPLPQPHSEFAFPRHGLGSEAFAIGAHPLPQPHSEFAFPRHGLGSEAFSVGARRLSKPPPEFAFPLHHQGSEAFAVGAHPLPPPPPKFTFPLHHHSSEAIAVGAQLEPPKEKRLINGQNSFPVELFRLLSDARTEGNEHVVSFTPSGRAFQVHKRDAFIRDIAPRYFSPRYFSSFLRQLNKYDFGKVVAGPEKGAFFHPYMQRGNIELCRKIRVKKGEDDSKKRYWSKQKACLFFQSDSVCDP